MTRPSTSSGTPSRERMPFSRRIGLRMSAWSTSGMTIGAPLGGDAAGEAAAERDPDALLDLLLDALGRAGVQPGRPRAAGSPRCRRRGSRRSRSSSSCEQVVLGEVGERGVGDALQRLEDLQGQRLWHGPEWYGAIYARAVRLRRVNTLSSAERSPNASAPVSTAASPRLETSTRGGYGQRCGEQLADRREQQVAVRADAAAEHDQLDVGHRRDRHDVARRSAAPPRRPRRARARRPRARRRRSRARRTAARARVASRPSAASARGVGGDADRRPGRRLALEVAAERVVDLARRAVVAAVQLAAQHEPGAEAGADREERRSPRRPGRRRATARRPRRG